MFFRSVSHESHRKHSSEDQVQGITSQTQAENQPSVRECCVEAKVLCRKQPAFKIFSLWFCFLFLIIESNELYISNMVYYIADCWY